MAIHPMIHPNRAKCRVAGLVRRTTLPYSYAEQLIIEIVISGGEVRSGDICYMNTRLRGV